MIENANETSPSSPVTTASAASPSSASAASGPVRAAGGEGGDGTRRVVPASFAALGSQARVVARLGELVAEHPAALSWVNVQFIGEQGVMVGLHDPDSASVLYLLAMFDVFDQADSPVAEVITPDEGQAYVRVSWNHMAHLSGKVSITWYASLAEAERLLSRRWRS